MKLRTLYQTHKTTIKNLILYGFIGGLAAVVDFGVFYGMNTGLGIDKFLANLISMHVGMLVSFSLNTTLNFKKTDKLFRRFLSYYVIVLGGMGISSAILWLGSFLTSSETIVKAFSVVLVAAIQFVFNKLITFKF